MNTTSKGKFNKAKYQVINSPTTVSIYYENKKLYDLFQSSKGINYLVKTNLAKISDPEKKAILKEMKKEFGIDYE